MCGFVGFVGGTDNQSEVLTKMMDRIVHRGPDMGGQFIDGRVALGFRRLSILDLTEAGAQPMANEGQKTSGIRAPETAEKYRRRLPEGRCRP